MSNKSRTEKRILLAEDHPLNAQIARTMIESRGYTVEIANDGKKASEMFADSAENYYSAVIMDVTMPVMDGLEAARIIRTMDRKDASLIPIIAMSAEDGDKDIDMAKNAGMDAYLVKPVVPEELFQILEELV